MNSITFTYTETVSLDQLLFGISLAYNTFSAGVRTAVLTFVFGNLHPGDFDNRPVSTNTCVA